MGLPAIILHSRHTSIKCDITGRRNARPASSTHPPDMCTIAQAPSVWSIPMAYMPRHIIRVHLYHPRQHHPRHIIRGTSSEATSSEAHHPSFSSYSSVCFICVFISLIISFICVFISSSSHSSVWVVPLWLTPSPPRTPRSQPVTHR